MPEDSQLLLLADPEWEIAAEWQPRELEIAGTGLGWDIKYTGDSSSISADKPKGYVRMTDVYLYTFMIEGK